MNIFKSWKTTSSGLAMIIGGASNAYFAYSTGTLTPATVNTSALAVLGGIGLVLAKDGDVSGTGGTKQQ